MGDNTGYMPKRAGVTGGKLFFLCFFLGILAGTVAGNLGFLQIREYREEGSESLEGQMFSAFGNAIAVNRPWREQAGSREKFFYIWKQRMGEGLMAWILGLTVCAAPLFWVLAVYMGFSLGWVVVCYTARLGVLGLYGFFLSCFPQWLFYLPAWYLFIWQGLNRPARVRVLPAFLALLLFGLGAGAESFLNPVFLQML